MFVDFSDDFLRHRGPQVCFQSRKDRKLLFLKVSSLRLLLFNKGKERGRAEQQHWMDGWIHPQMIIMGHLFCCLMVLIFIHSSLPSSFSPLSSPSPFLSLPLPPLLFPPLLFPSSSVLLKPGFCLRHLVFLTFNNQMKARPFSHPSFIGTIRAPVVFISNLGIWKSHSYL